MGFQGLLHIEITNPHHLLGAGEFAEADVGGVDRIAAIERIGAGLVDDGLQPWLAKLAAAAIEPDAVDVEDIEEVVETQADGAGPFIDQGSDHDIPLMVEGEQTDRVELSAFRRRVIGTGLLFEKHPGALLDGKEGGDRLQTAVTAAGTGAAIRVDDGVAYLAAAKQGAPVDLAVDDKGRTYAVVDVDDAKIPVCFPALPLLRQGQHDAIVIHHHLAAEALFQQILEFDRCMPGGLRHGLGDPGGRVDLAMYRQRQADRHTLVAPLVLVVAGFNQAQ